MLFLFDGLFTYLNYLHISANLNQPMQHDVTEENMSEVIGYGFVSLFLILMRLVPLDVIISTEMAKVWMGYIIKNDAEMM